MPLEVRLDHQHRTKPSVGAVWLCGPLSTVRPEPRAASHKPASSHLPKSVRSRPTCQYCMLRRSAIGGRAAASGVMPRKLRHHVHMARPPCVRFYPAYPAHPRHQLEVGSPEARKDNTILDAAAVVFATPSGLLSGMAQLAAAPACYCLTSRRISRPGNASRSMTIWSNHE